MQHNTNTETVPGPTDEIATRIEEKVWKLRELDIDLEGNKFEIADLHYEIGRLEMDRGEHKRAQWHLQLAYYLRCEIYDPWEMPIPQVLNALGEVFVNQEQYQSAVLSFELAKENVSLSSPWHRHHIPYLEEWIQKAKALGTERPVVDGGTSEPTDHVVQRLCRWDTFGRPHEEIWKLTTKKELELARACITNLKNLNLVDLTTNFVQRATSAALRGGLDTNDVYQTNLLLGEICELRGELTNAEHRYEIALYYLTNQMDADPEKIASLYERVAPLSPDVESEISYYCGAIHYFKKRSETKHRCIEMYRHLGCLRGQEDHGESFWKALLIGRECGDLVNREILLSLCFLMFDCNLDRQMREVCMNLIQVLYPHGTEMRRSFLVELNEEKFMGSYDKSLCDFIFARNPGDWKPLDTEAVNLEICSLIDWLNDHYYGCAGVQEN